MDRIFYRDGVAASVVDELLHEAGVARGTLYRNFRTRDALLEAYLQGRHDSTLAILERISREDSSLEGKVDAVFDYLANLASDDLFRGCAFVVAAAELPDEERPPLRWARLHKRATFETFQKMFETHGTRDARLMAERLAVLYDGALITSFVRPDSDAVNTARAMAKEVLLTPTD